MGQVLKKNHLISLKVCLIDGFILDATSTKRFYFLLLGHFFLKFLLLTAMLPN